MFYFWYEHVEIRKSELLVGFRAKVGEEGIVHNFNDTVRLRTSS